MYLHRYDRFRKYSDGSWAILVDFGGIWGHFSRDAVGISQHFGGFGGQKHAGWCGGEVFWGWGWLKGREGKVKVRGGALDL